MHSDFKTPQEYVDSLPEDRKLVIEKLRKVIKSNLPIGFQEEMSYGMLVMLCRFQFMKRATIAIQNCRFLLLILLSKKILSLFITWEFIPTLN